MKSLLAIIALSLSLNVLATVKEVQKVQTKSSAQSRNPASTTELKRLIEIDERRGCCSHHGGVSHCSSGTLYCNDGWASGCGC